METRANRALVMRKAGAGESRARYAQGRCGRIGALGDMGGCILNIIRQDGESPVKRTLDSGLTGRL